MAFIYFPNGAQQQHWFPTGDESNFELSPTLAPLGDVRHQIQILTGLDHVNAEPGPDGAGDHARANATFLTGVRARKTAGADIRAGVSVDQIAAQHLGKRTRFASLELSCDAVRKSGSCDSGYSCAYQFNLSWRSPTTPMAPETNPRAVFERLFGDGGAGDLSKRRQQQQSVLDLVLDDAETFRHQLDAADRRKLDEYLTGVRELEQRLADAENWPELPRPAMPAPDGIPSDYGDYLSLMFDMLALALQTDATRIATFLMAGDGSNRAFPHIGIPEGHHYLTHQQHKTELAEKVAQIDRFYVERFAKFLAKLEASREADGSSVLDHSMIVYGGGIADGNEHSHTNLPIVLAGGGGATLRPGRFVRMPSMPMTNLFVSLLDRLGIPEMQQFGDSTGRCDLI
jgi:hypothetical protein